MGKGPYRLGVSFLDAVGIFIFHASSHTCCPGSSVRNFLGSLVHFWSADCALSLALMSSLRRWSIDGEKSSDVLRLTWGFMLIRSSCGVCQVFSCLQEL